MSARDHADDARREHEAFLSGRYMHSPAMPEGRADSEVETYRKDVIALRERLAASEAARGRLVAERRNVAERLVIIAGSLVGEAA